MERHRAGAGENLEPRVLGETWRPFVGGIEVSVDRYCEDIDPSSGEILASVGVGDRRLVREAVTAAADCLSGWRRVSPADRGAILRRIGAAIRSEARSLSDLESLDTGKPLAQAETDVEVAARYFDFYADALRTLYGDSIPLGEDFVAYTLREALGVTAHIIPWNYPLQIAARTVAPALAAGNCCVLKPAEEAPLTALRLARLAVSAGLPPGALNVVPGEGEIVGAELAANPAIGHLSFTGSFEVGRLVAAAAAANVVPVTLELGGKSPNIVFADADLGLAVRTIVTSILQNAGQTCSAGSRLLVQESVHKQVVEAVAERFAKVAIGPGMANPDLGPLISGTQLERVTRYVVLGRENARLVSGGGRPAGAALSGGFFFEPTLFDSVPASSPLAQEEVFGPVLSVISFRTEEEAVALANATPYGLVAAVWTRDLNVAHRMAREIRAGQVYINTYGAGGGVEIPFGGFGRSGYGREKGVEALITFTQTKAVVIKLAGAAG